MKWEVKVLEEKKKDAPLDKTDSSSKGDSSGETNLPSPSTEESLGETNLPSPSTEEFLGETNLPSPNTEESLSETNLPSPSTEESLSETNLPSKGDSSGETNLPSSAPSNLPSSAPSNMDDKKEEGQSVQKILPASMAEKKRRTSKNYVFSSERNQATNKDSNS